MSEKLPKRETASEESNGSPEDLRLHEKYKSFLEKIQDRLSPEEIEEFMVLNAESVRQEESSRTDELTGLLNRRGFKEQWNSYVAFLKRERAKGEAISSAFLAIDLDDFKYINDSFGHESGDRFLELVAEKVKLVLRDTDVFGRIGGDEFSVFLVDSTAEGALRVARDIRDAIEGINGVMREEYPGYRINASASIGIATIDGEGHLGDDKYTTLEQHPTMDEIKRYADYVLYVEKQRGGKKGEITLQQAWALDPDREMEKAFLSERRKK